jgi:hypothetical protein
MGEADQETQCFLNEVKECHIQPAFLYMTLEMKLKEVNMAHGCICFERQGGDLGRILSANKCN